MFAMKIDHRAAAIAACAICTGLTLGTMLIFPIWAPVWMIEFSQNRGAVMLLYSITGILMSGSMMVVGRLIVKFPIWQVIAAGGVLMGGGIILASMITNFFLFALVYVISVGFGVACSSTLPSQSLAARLYPERLGVIGGLLMIAMALCGVGFPPLFIALKAWLGWRPAFAFAGIAILVLVPSLAVGLVRLPDSDTLAQTRDEANSGSPTFSTPQILGHSRFWIIALAIFPMMATSTAVQANFLPLLADHGIDATKAGYILSLFAAGGAFGALLFGWLGDRADPRLIVWVAAGLTVASIVAFVTGDGPTIISLASAILGLAAGGFLPIMSVLTLRQFGSSYAPAFGLLNAVMLPYMLAPAVMGYVRDLTGSYSYALLAVIPALILCSAGTWTLNRASVGGSIIRS